MKILVIAASGFLGRRVYMELVRRGHTVTGTSVTDGDFVHLDVTDRASCRRTFDSGRFDSVVNLAGKGVTAGSASRREMHRVNYEGATALAEAIADAQNPPWLVHAASSTEPKATHNPESAYSASKSAGTQAFVCILDRALIPFSLARVHNVYGPLQPDGRFVMCAIRSLIAGVEVHLRHPVRVRDFCYVDDVVQHLADLSETTHPSRFVTEIGTGKGSRLGDLVELVRSRVGASPDLVVPHFTRSVDPNEYQVADSEGPGFLRCRTSLVNGIDMTIRSLS